MRAKILRLIMQVSLTDIKDIVQVGFFAVMGTVAVLSYLKARKTLLQPLRTEVFKEQLRLLSDTLSLFIGKGELDLRDSFALHEMFDSNAIKLLDDYAEEALSVKVNREERRYRKYRVANVHPKTPVTPLDGHFKEHNNDKSGNERIEKTSWEDYFFWVVDLPDGFVEGTRRIQNIMDSPLLPTQLLSLLREFLDAVNANVNLTRDLLNECARELPALYPQIEHVNKSSIDWMRSRYTKHFVHLEPKAKAIIDYVRKYYAPDRIFD